MDRNHNILLAKKYMVESIYRSANIEGIAMTFPETQAICDGMSVAGHSVDDVDAVSDLNRAWKWLFANIESSIDVDTLCQINRVLGKYTVINAGSIRNRFDDPIRVTLQEGEYYYPPVPPEREMISLELRSITNGSDIQTAFDLFCYVCKAQLFNDGNKRTATLITNLFMIQNGLGILSIPVEKKVEFYNALIAYYSDDERKGELVSFLKEYCLTGYREGVVVNEQT